MMKLTVLLISVCSLSFGCAFNGTSGEDSSHEQRKLREPTDLNRNSVPDSLERKAVPMEPVIDRRLKSSD
jgi:hypothetical protein